LAQRANADSVPLIINLKITGGIKKIMNLTF